MNKWRIYFFAIIIIISALFIFSVFHKDDVIYEEYFIPCNYTGWVNLIYDMPGESKFYQCDDKRIYILSGDLINCYINTSPKAGSFDITYYRYSENKLVKLVSPTFGREHKTHIPVEYGTSIVIKGKSHYVSAFYVSAIPISRALPDDALPENPLQNSIPATVIK